MPFIQMTEKIAWFIIAFLLFYKNMHVISTAIFFIFVTIIINSVDLNESQEYSDLKQEQVVVRAVFINCEPNEDQNYLENDATRFQREELFKHSALQGCHKKLALTVKMTSEPDKSSGDEYIPIEHVFDGSNKRRARLLDPYILRIRRDSPMQAYKLRRIDIVSGILTKSSERGTSKFKKNRVQRNLDKLSEQKEHSNEANRLNTAVFEVEEKQNAHQCLFPGNTSNVSQQIKSLKSKISKLLTMPSVGKQMNEGHSKNHIYQDVHGHTRVKRNVCTFGNNPEWKRDKRHEHNIIVEDITDDYKIPWVTKDRFYRRLEQVPSSAGVLNEKSTLHKIEEDNDLKVFQKTKPLKHRASRIMQNEHYQASSRQKTEERINRNDNFITSTPKLSGNSYNFIEHTTRRNLNDKKDKNSNKKTSVDSPEKNFVLYEIGSPDLWYTVHVQLFEKMSTSEGKTVWNDITKGEVASVSSVQPEWMDSDINVKYKPTEWISKDEFILPASSNLCLLVPMSDESTTDTNDDVVTDLNTAVGKYIVVHKDDIVDIEANQLLSKRDGNYSAFGNILETNNLNNQNRRRVLVRVSRALLAGIKDDLRVSSLGSDHFLTLPHRLPHHAQIDLEARADENQLIRVGSSGSIITVVADNSRRTRSVITVQATNKGLAAARFRVKARDCGPEMASFFDEKDDELVAGPVLLPPRHTLRFRLELPTEIPVDIVHCSVALVNDDDESVAVRDVAIKKGDRCFCVWHCDCVCLNEDPKLLCREMTETRQIAAGLSLRGRTRLARSVCYPDVVTLNLFVVIVGVLMALLLLGLAKACLGLFCRCIGKWGLYRLIQMPRKLDHYYEPGLSGRTVVYDDEGWPVHPDTKKRNVSLVPRLIEFILNIIFFITVPCLMIHDAVKQMIWGSRRQSGSVPEGRDAKKCFSAHDMQMRPLLHERHRATGPTGEAVSSCVDSEQDDTEYVLMQMQKSKESLAKTQKKLNESGTSSITAKKQSHNIAHQK